jgi:hypothetical protein
MFSILLGVFLGFVGTVVLGNYLTFRDRYKIKKSLTLWKVDEKKLCKTPHAWMDAAMNTPKGMSQVKVCRVCGFVSGTDLMASQEMIDRVEDQNKLYEIEKRLEKEFLDQEDEEIKKFFSEELKGGLSFDKLVKLHSAGTTLSERFSIYKLHKAKDIEKEIQRGDA